MNKESQHLKEIIDFFKGKDYLEIIKSHFSINFEKNINFQKKHNKKRIFLKNNIGFFKEIKMLLLIYLNFRNQKKIFTNKNDENNIVIKKIFSIKPFFSSINNYRFYIQLKILFKIIKPKIIFFPYEGLPWERLIIIAAKKNNNNIRCIGIKNR